eukprot:9480213-Pyramimonas_sp.AAC.1
MFGPSWRRPVKGGGRQIGSPPGGESAAKAAVQSVIAVSSQRPSWTLRPLAKRPVQAQAEGYG